jgi:DNA mismatch repair ATPase MutS
VDHDEQGEIVFNYILKRGMSRQYIALELLKNNGFDDDVIKDAMDICNKIKDNKIISFATKNETLLESDITDRESSNESPTISKKKEKKEQKEKKNKKNQKQKKEEKNQLSHYPI